MIDQTTVQQLALALCKVIKAHFQKGEPDRAKVFELLNALAIATASVIADNEGAEEFFAEALDAQVQEMQRLNKRAGGDDDLS